MSAHPILLPDGKLLVPEEPLYPCDPPDWVEVDSDHPEYRHWLALAKAGEDPRPKPRA